MEEIVVADFGSSTTKVGPSGEKPSDIFPSIIGTPKYKPMFDFFPKTKTEYVGEIAKVNVGYLDIENPILNGKIQNWNHFEQLSIHAFRSFKPGFKCLLIEPSLSPTDQREKKTQVAFEKLSISNLYISNPTTLSLLASGMNRAVVVDIGDSTTEISAFEENSIVKNSVQSYNFGGRDLTKILEKMLTEQALHFGKSEYFTLEDIKKKLGFVSSDPQNENLEVKDYELPDGEVIKLSNERYRFNEGLFNPKLHYKTQNGIHEIIYETIKSTNINCCLLVGGTTLTSGFQERVHKEITKLSGNENEIKFVTPVGRENYSWVGGSLLTGLSGFEKNWISKEEYEENGPSIIHKKCILE